LDGEPPRTSHIKKAAVPTPATTPAIRRKPRRRWDEFVRTVNGRDLHSVRVKAFWLRQIRFRNYLTSSVLIVPESYPMSSLSGPASATRLHVIFTIAFCQTDCDNIRKNLTGADSAQSINGRKGSRQMDAMELCWRWDATGRLAVAHDDCGSLVQNHERPNIK
jgi:hypothetical protein